MNALLVQTDRRRGFTLTELLVVIGVIAVLAGILLAAMGGVRRKAMATTTVSTMTEFSKACDTFQLEHGRYPGAIPENVIADSSIDIPPISSTENALLDLMGGYRVMGPSNTSPPADWDDFDPGNAGVIEHSLDGGNWLIRVDINRLGEGPLLFGKPYSPYFTPSASQVGVAQGQASSIAAQLPDLLDAWGQPIIFVRRARPSGPLVGLDTSVSPQPQFYTKGMLPYTTSTKLGEFGKDQLALSILNTAPGQLLQDATFAQILRHPSLGNFGTEDYAQAGTAQGAYILISAGPDGIYFSEQDGPGTTVLPVNDIVIGQYDNPAIVKEYDDIRIFGGG